MTRDLPVDPELIADGNFTIEAAITGARRLLTLENPPTAIFAANDQSAIGVLTAAELLGLRVPADLSVVGFDNIPQAAYLELTTIDQFIDQMGYLSAHLLADLIQGNPLDTEVVEIETQLIVRGSTAPRS